MSEDFYEIFSYSTIKNLHFFYSMLYVNTVLIILLCLSVSVEQVKGTTELRQKIISAAKESRRCKEYPVELQHPDCIYITDKYNEHTNKVLPQTHGPYPNLERKNLMYESCFSFLFFSEQ